jgi:hypothetical protein
MIRFRLKEGVVLISLIVMSHYLNLSALSNDVVLPLRCNKMARAETIILGVA